VQIVKHVSGGQATKVQHRIGVFGQKVHQLVQVPVWLLMTLGVLGAKRLAVSVDYCRHANGDE